MNGSTLPISVQASLLELNRSGLYYQPAPHSTEDLYIKQMIDKIYTRYPMYGYRRICWYLNEKEHYLINHKAVLRHMQEMGIQAVYPRQNTSRPEPANKIYPYLLKGLKIDHPDHVWSHRHYLYTSQNRLALFGGNHRLVLTVCAALAAE